MGGMSRSIAVILCLCLVVGTAQTAFARFLSPKQAGSPPRSRIACYPSSTLGTRYPDPSHLGHHSYGFSPWERNGIVYTCRAGHIDITHLRKGVDWTAYLAFHIRQALLDDKTTFSFHMHEPSRHYLQFKYPEAWASLPQNVREQIAAEVAIPVAAYCTYTAMVWHEMLTWFGYKSIGIYTEYPSAFSWEDVYSNLLGCRVAAEALRDPGLDFEEAATALIDRELQSLGVRPRPAAWQAGQIVRGQWFVGDFLTCDIVKRNFDIGWDDGFVTPWVVTGMGGCPDETPALCPIPDLTELSEYHFSAKYEIEPREWERKEVLKLLYPSGRRQHARIDPAQHFGAIIEYIRAQAIHRYGPYVDDGTLALPSAPAMKPAGAGGVAAAAPVTAGASLGMQPQIAHEAAKSSPATVGLNNGRWPTIDDALVFAYFWLAQEP